MKRVVLLLLVFTSLLLLSNCGKVKERRMTDEDRLISKNWTSYKVENNGLYVTSSSTTITYTFLEEGYLEIYDHSEPILSIGGGNIGRWSLTDSILYLGFYGTWVVQSLTKTELILRHTVLDYVVYYH